MKIEELHLLSNDLDLQEVFYGSTMGFITERRSDGRLHVHCGETMLIFHSSESSSYFYHFCFLIPTGSIESAIAFANGIALKLLPNQGKTITHFDNGRSVYFHDGNENIAEFIERPLVDYPVKASFSIDDLIRINEIGLPTPAPERIAKELCDDYGIVPLAPESFDDVFCWAGDHEGVIIVVKEGRGWLPTGRPCIAAPFKVLYKESTRFFEYRHDWPIDQQDT